MVIINKGKVVAVDTPDKLTDRLQGTQTLYLQVDAAPGTDVAGALTKVPGVTRVTSVDQKDGSPASKSSASTARIAAVSSRSSS